MKDREPIQIKKDNTVYMIYEDLNGITHIERDLRITPFPRLRTVQDECRFVNPLLDITIFQKGKDDKTT